MFIENTKLPRVFCDIMT